MSESPLLPRLPPDHLERVDAWGGARRVAGYVWRPSTVDNLGDVLACARRQGVFVGLRGAGRSYGDAAQAAENLTLDLSRLRRILEWNPVSGVIRCEPGVTIRDLWQYALGDGWWPYVVSGTMHPTLGGAAAMNIHGKNNFMVGTIGDHIRAFELLLPGTGEIVRCSPDENSDLFYAAIGGFGVIGVFVSITLELKKIHSGLLQVTPIPVADWRELFAVFAERTPRADYLVGWIDAFAGGRAAGRGLVHQANYLPPGADPNPAQTLRIEAQELPDTILGILPKSALWRFMRPFVNNTGVRAVNWLKSLSSRRGTGAHTVSHAGFHFLLDYVPNWKKAYGSGGLIQHQAFVPKENAEAVFSEQLQLCRRRGIVPYLAVFKRHRPDAFLMTHSVDGYSLALDFPVTSGNRAALWELCGEMDRIVIAAGGRFYFAKDLTLNSDRLENYLHEERVARFLEIKRRTDPEMLLQTDLFRRVFAPLL